MTQFGLDSEFKMTQQKVKRVANPPGWTTVPEVMIKSRRADAAFRTTKQERWNQLAQDRLAHQDFLEEHRGTGKFSGKYAPQPQQTEMIWTMPWGCWVELEDQDVHCKEWECMIENFTEETANTAVHRIYGQHATLSVNYKPRDWESVQAWILKTVSGWHQAETAEDPQNMNKFAAGSLGAGPLGVVTAHRIKLILSGRSVVEQIRQWQQALQAEQIMDAEPKRVSSRSAFQITETKEGGTMVITTTRVTQMRDIVKTSQMSRIGFARWNAME